MSTATREVSVEQVAPDLAKITDAIRLGWRLIPMYERSGYNMLARMLDMEEPEPEMEGKVQPFLVPPNYDGRSEIGVTATICGIRVCGVLPVVVGGAAKERGTET